MTISELPYFMTNGEWYYFDPDEWRYKLTELGSAIPSVVESYDKFYDDERMVVFDARS